jgi:hypothetical protein
VGDLDSDGWLDLFVPIYPYGADGNVLYHSLGPNSGGEVTFEDVTASAGVASPSGTIRPEGVQLVDVDDDGDLDLYSNGVLYQNVTDGAIRFDTLSPGRPGSARPGCSTRGPRSVTTISTATSTCTSRTPTSTGS